MNKFSLIYLFDGNITKLNIEAIVNAANSSLSGGGGVDGAIHRMAGQELLNECLTLQGCPAGEAKITKGYNLSATYVIHTVGPVWQGGGHNEKELLASCYCNCFRLIKQYGIKSAAFPAISTGVYGFPKQEAAEIAVHQTIAGLEDNPQLTKIIFTCFNRDSCKAYENALEKFNIPIQMQTS